ncbi:hypothetical protein Plhal710r2_c050g0155221 [Plasmopara halstedii]
MYHLRLEQQHSREPISSMKDVLWYWKLAKVALSIRLSRHLILDFAKNGADVEVNPITSSSCSLQLSRLNKSTVTAMERGDYSPHIRSPTLHESARR